MDVKLENLDKELGTDNCEQLLQRLKDLSISNVSTENIDWYAAELKKEIQSKREVRINMMSDGYKFVKFGEVMARNTRKIVTLY